MPRHKHETRRRHPSPEAPYWADDLSLFAGRFRLTRNEPSTIRACVHYTDESYRRHADGPEIVSLSPATRTRTHLRLQPYLALPDLRAIVEFSPTTPADTHVGTLAGAGFAPDRVHPIGDAQAWYYPADHTLVLWECFLDDRYRDAPLADDDNTARLWDGVEDYLTTHFPTATRIITPPDDPLFDDDAYRAFLHARGFAPLSPTAFGKTIERG